jgi:transposase
MPGADELLGLARRKIDELQRELAFWQALHDALAQIAGAGSAGRHGRDSGFVTADALARERRQQDRKPVAVTAEWRGGCVTLAFGAPVRRGVLSWLEERLARRLNLSVAWQADGDRVSAVELCGAKSEEARREVERAVKWLERRLGAKP